MSVESTTATKPRTESQRAASRINGSRSKGPRSAEGRVRSSMNRTVHALNATRLLLATEDVAEYQRHVGEWVESLVPVTPAERQIVLLIADQAWRLRRVSRIEERRALAVLDSLVENTPEWAMRSKAQQLLTALDTVGELVTTSKLPVPTMALAAFLGGLRGVIAMLDEVRELLPVEMWPQAHAALFLSAEKALAKEADTEEQVTATFTALGTSATVLATALRTVAPALDAAVEKARSAISTDTLLADDGDKQFERHRRILEASMSRQLDLLAKVKAAAQAAAASGSSERAAPVELRVVRA
ncbi:hypothetical protein [Anaeromyxobacter sp. SG64]|uniref:hypothetical protein n=1 Tax=Anaeromyxobacter sp. SG64 TaxID=2925409 RepID=UPI001F5778F3|nr:hypothetical protein [Anaeromyxobacter sp. SG64]